MRRKFSNSWKASRLPRKQVKYRVNAPLNLRHKMMSIHLSKELRKKYLRRNFEPRKGDSIKVISGGFKKKTGKISLVDKRRFRIAIEGIQRTKKDGTKINVFFNPSNLQIQELTLDDKKRIKSTERRIKHEHKLEVKHAPEKK
jgi:large subunit ribosomal protein L24